METAPPLLAVNNIEVIYNHVILVLKGVSLSVPERGIVALLGANGAGKTTSLKAISNLLRAERGEVTKGSITFAGARIDRLDAADVVRRGLIQVMEGRHCFEHLTVEENLLTGAYTRRDGRAAIAAELDRVYAYFPRLRARRRAITGYTSGGEQQMVALGRALMARPRLVLLDEPSLGLAPQLVEEIFEIVARLNAETGVGFLVAEQNTNIALKYAGYGYILENGRVVMDGAATALRENEDVKEFYLGLSAAGRKSYREIKFYRRRKRWLACAVTAFPAKAGIHSSAPETVEQWIPAFAGNAVIASQIGEADPGAEGDRAERAERDHRHAAGTEQQEPEHKGDDRTEDAADQRGQRALDVCLGHPVQPSARAGRRESEAVARTFFKSCLRKRVS